MIETEPGSLSMCPGGIPLYGFVGTGPSFAFGREPDPFPFAT